MVWRTSNTDALAWYRPYSGEAATATWLYYSKARLKTGSNFAGSHGDLVDKEE